MEGPSPSPTLREVALARARLEEQATAAGHATSRQARRAPWLLGLVGLGALAVLVVLAALLATPALLFIGLPLVAVALMFRAWPVRRRRRGPPR